MAIALRGPAQFVNAVGIAHREGAQYISVENGKQRRVQTQREPDSSNHCSGESRGSAEAPQSIANVQQQRLQPCEIPTRTAFFERKYNIAHGMLRTVSRFRLR